MDIPDSISLTADRKHCSRVCPNIFVDNFSLFPPLLRSALPGTKINEVQYIYSCMQECIIGVPTKGALWTPASLPPAEENKILLTEQNEEIISGIGARGNCYRLLYYVGPEGVRFRIAYERVR